MDDRTAIREKGSTEMPPCEIPILMPHFLPEPGGKAYGIIPRSRFLRKQEAAFLFSVLLLAFLQMLWEVKAWNGKARPPR
jgi:hypothetical protein